jgi:hypothetical protein
MKTENFIKLVQSFTGRDFQVETNDLELESEKTYSIYRYTPIKKYKISFDFKVPKNEESIIKSFINTFCNKYKEPDPANYDGKYANDPKDKWEFFTDEQKENCYFHHSSNMFYKTDLMEQVKENLGKSEIEDVLCQYGFYHTLYGIGIFILLGGQYELNAIDRMKKYLSEKNIPFKNQLSDAHWVFRFVININKDVHKSLLTNFK